MNKALFVVAAVLFAFYPIHAFARDLNSWGTAFDCAVDWFGECKSFTEKRTEDAKQPLADVRNAFLRNRTSTEASLPLPVRNVLENPNPETARAYVLWSRQARERLAKASEYIADATREINSDVNIEGRNNNLALAGLGPVGLYYFFSPGDESAGKDVAVLNRIWREGNLGVVGISVGGTDEEVGNYMNEAKPLFPIRRSDAEVKVIKPGETPDLYLALPLKKKIFRLGPTITETAIEEAIRTILPGQSEREFIMDSLGSNR